jgi:5-methylcytosine-specific restriction enzyme subunit McrC
VKPRVIELIEYQPRHLSRDELRPEDARLLWERYGKRINVEFPSPRTADRYILTPQGWVGYLPLTPELHLELRTKVPVVSVFAMLEYAYKLEGFEILSGVRDCTSLDELFEKLAHILALRVLSRARRGFYREYLRREESLRHLRGRLLTREALRKPWEVRLWCRYEEHTADIDDNTLLAWTLQRVSRSAACGERSRPAIRRAYHSLAGLVALRAHGAAECRDRLYHRLNEDYQPLHALCAFLLEHSGPAQTGGDRDSIPFLLDMHSLFELFVFGWLTAHAPPQLRVDCQYVTDDELGFRADIVLKDRATDKLHCVIDTKYKTPDKAAAADIQQVLAYAEMLDCDEAVLLYPVEPDQPFDGCPGQSPIRVRTLAFPLDGDLDTAGRNLLSELPGPESTAPAR